MVYEAKDPNNGTNFTIQIRTYPMYYRVNHVDSLFKAFQESSTYFVNQLNDIEEKGKEPDKNFYFQSGILSGPKSTGKVRYKYLLQGNKTYEIYAYMSKELATDSSYNERFNSLYLSSTQPGSNPDFDFTTSKTKLLLNDLKSQDTVRFEEAKKALGYYEFDSLDVSALYESLFYKYNDSSTTYNSVKSQVIEVLDDLHDGRYIEILDSLYYADEEPRANILGSLTALNRKALSLNLFCANAPVDPPYYSIYDVVSNFADSSDLFLNNLDCILETAGRNTTIRRPVLDVLTQYYDSLEMQDEHRHLLIGKVGEWYRQDIDSLIRLHPDSTDYNLSSNVVSEIELLTTLSLGDMDTLINKAESLKMLDVQKALLVYKLKFDKTYDKEVLDKVITDEYYGWEFITKLSGQKAIDALPMKYQSPSQLSKMALIDYFYYDDYVPDKIKQISSVKIVKEGKTLNYYLYEFSYEGDEDNQYLAVSGGIMQKDGSVLLSDLYTNYDYTPISSKKHRKQLADQLIEWAKADRYY